MPFPSYNSMVLIDDERKRLLWLSQLGLAYLYLVWIIHVDRIPFFFAPCIKVALLCCRLVQQSEAVISNSISYINPSKDYHFDHGVERTCYTEPL